MEPVVIVEILIRSANVQMDRIKTNPNKFRNYV